MIGERGFFIRTTYYVRKCSSTFKSFFDDYTQDMHKTDFESGFIEEEEDLLQGDTD